MAEEQTGKTELTRINWGECFGFTNLFRTFRLALHPSKLVLAVVGLVLTLVLGLVLDAVWPADHEPYANEINDYVMVADFQVRRATVAAEQEGGPPTTGIFRQMLGFQTTRVLALCESVLNFDLFAGLQYTLMPRTETMVPARIGALANVVLMIQGVQWLIFEHYVYAIIFFVVFLAIWSWLGGAICRIAALDAARDEKPPLKQALGFAGRKYVNFAGAPLMGLALIAILGIALGIGGLLTSIPYAGEIVFTPFTFVALLVGGIITAVLIALVAGGGLMWPTIAIEGSDAFDAISCSFSYIYTKPWRTLLYAVVTLVYGALCYLFVRFFVFIMLILTRVFIGCGMFPTSRPLFTDADKLDVMWPAPTFGHLVSWPNTYINHMQGWDYFGACLIWFWAVVLVLFMYAFVVTFYFSGCTMIYLLLRREVDVTDMDDVFVEEYEEPAPEPVPAAPAGAPPAEAPSPEPSPPPQEPTEDKPDTSEQNP
jgi:hypothetical protein